MTITAYQRIVLGCWCHIHMHSAADSAVYVALSLAWHWNQLSVHGSATCWTTCWHTLHAAVFCDPVRPGFCGLGSGVGATCWVRGYPVAPFASFRSEVCLLRCNDTGTGSASFVCYRSSPAVYAGSQKFKN